MWAASLTEQESLTVVGDGVLVCEGAVETCATGVRETGWFPALPPKAPDQRAAARSRISTRALTAMKAAGRRTRVTGDTDGRGCDSPSMVVCVKKLSPDRGWRDTDTGDCWSAWRYACAIASGVGKRRWGSFSSAARTTSSTGKEMTGLSCDGR